MTRAGVVTDPGDLSNDLLLTAPQEAAMASRDHTDAALSEFVSFNFIKTRLGYIYLFVYNTIHPQCVTRLVFKHT